jgi:hypothetical protein
MNKPGPDYVRVLAVLKKQDKQEWLVHLATNLVNNEPPRSVRSEETGLPPEFVLDTSFHAVPLGPYQPDTLDFENERISLDDAGLSVFLPRNSEYFIIRGFVQPSDRASMPVEIKGKGGETVLKLYSDPAAPVPRCCAPMTTPLVRSTMREPSSGLTAWTPTDSPVPKSQSPCSTAAFFFSISAE